MIGAISASGGYTGLQWSAYAAPVRSSVSPASDSRSATAVHKSSGLETPVQPIDTAKPVTSEASGNLNIDLSVRNSADITEMAVRMRISPESADAQAQKTGPQDDEFAAEEAERQARMDERIQMEKEAEAEREAYLESLSEAEEAREQRLEALQEALAEGNGTEEETENAASPADKEEESARQTGFLELDHTAALLRNYQMTNLLQDQLAARAKGEDTTGYSAAIDAVFQSSQNQVRFVSGNELDERKDVRQPYQQSMNKLMPGVAA